jgi:phosphatidylglycerophosphate synthase
MERLKRHQKSSAGAPAYSRFVNRPLGRFLAAAGYHLRLTPDAVTLISAVWSGIGIGLLFTTRPTISMGIAVAVLLALGYAFDAADGQLARLGGGGSAAGEWLDHVVDCAKVSLLHAAVLVSLERTGVPRAWLYVPLGFLVVANLFFFTYIVGALLFRDHGGGARPPSASSSVLRSLAALPTDYGLLCAVFLLWGVPSVFLGVYGLLLLGTMGYLALALPKRFRELKALRPPRAG